MPSHTQHMYLLSHVLLNFSPSLRRQESDVGYQGFHYKSSILHFIREVCPFYEDLRRHQIVSIKNHKIDS